MADRKLLGKYHLWKGKQIPLYMALNPCQANDFSPNQCEGTPDKQPGLTNKMFVQGGWPTPFK